MKALTVLFISALTLGCGTGEEDNGQLPPMQEPAAPGAPAGGGSTTTQGPDDVPLTECVCPAGQPGEPGATGAPGADGSSCSVAPTVGGINVTCGSATASLSHGDAGPAGSVGQTGPAGGRGETGTTGATGAMGPAGQSIVGPQGERGETGSPGALDPGLLYTVVNSSWQGSGSRYLEAICDSGDVLLTGGCSMSGTQSLGLQSSRPDGEVSSGAPDRWHCFWVLPSSGAIVEAKAVCVTP